MKIALFGGARIAHKTPELNKLLDDFESEQITYYLNADFAAMIEEMTHVVFSPDQIYDPAYGVPKDADYLLSYGGDGTFLDSVRLAALGAIPVLGVNSGRLGFLANVTKEGLRTALQDIKAGYFTLEERALLKVEGDADIRFPYAFNEFSLQKGGVNMIDVEVWVDGEFASTYRGDGVLTATPSGSTAYSLSVGGPVIAPACRCLVISPIASHNLTMRPVVIPDDVELTFRIASREDGNFMTIDNHRFEVENGSRFRVIRAEKSILLVHLQNISFYETLRNKMMWGVDLLKRN